MVGGLNKIARFDGRGDVNKFIKAIRKRQYLEEWSDDRTKRIIYYQCNDAAETFLESVEDSENLPLDDIIELLKKRFEVKLTLSDIITELNSITQKSDVMEEYIQRFEESAHKLRDIRGLEDCEKEEIKKNAFINGLNSNIRTLLSINEFRSFEDCLKAAKRCGKSVTSSAAENSNIVATAVHSTADTASWKPQNPTPSCGICRKQGHTTDDCWYRQPSHVRQNRDDRRYDRRVKPYYRYQGRYANSHTGSIRCYRCNKIGHMRNNCSEQQPNLRQRSPPNFRPRNIPYRVNYQPNITGNGNGNSNNGGNNLPKN